MSDTSTPLVAPFVAEHYTALDRLSDLIAPPYDVIAPAERAALGARHPHNIVHVMLPEANGDRYAAAAGLLKEWRRAKIVTRERKPAVFVMRQEFATPDGHRHARTGVFAGIAAEPYAPGRVRPHEKTHAGPKADRLALLQATSTMLESIFLLAPDKKGILRKLLDEVAADSPTATAVLGGVTISLWRVTGPAAKKIADVAGADALYIADGHHRFETAGAYRAHNPVADRTIGLIVPLGDPGLVVLPTYRLIRGSPIDGARLAEILAAGFDVEPIEPELDVVSLLAERGRNSTAAIVALPTGKMLLLNLKAGADLAALGGGVAAGLDVARVDAMVVGPIVQMAGPDARVDYSADPATTLNELAQKRCVAAVLLNPTRVKDVLAVADAGEVMPQKSTYFIPKVPSGLVMLPYGGPA